MDQLTILLQYSTDEKVRHCLATLFKMDTRDMLRPELEAYIIRSANVIVSGTPW